MKRIKTLLFGIFAIACIIVFAEDARFIIHDYASINPYSDTTKTYTDVKKIELINDDEINVLYVFNTGNNDKTTSDTGIPVMAATDRMVLFRSLDTRTITVLLKGNTATDTGTVPIIVYK